MFSREVVVYPSGISCLGKVGICFSINSIQCAIQTVRDFAYGLALARSKAHNLRREVPGSELGGGVYCFAGMLHGGKARDG